MKKCRNCREPFTPIRSTLEKFCQKDECLRVFVAEAKDKEWKKRKAKKKEELMTLSDYIKIAQQVFNKYIRLRDKDKGCISCGKPLGVRYDCGHFYSAGGHANLRFDEDNCHGQHSRPCNMDLSGDLLRYRVGLLDRIGEERLKILEDKAYISRKFTVEELKELIKKYKEKTTLLEKNR